MKTLQNLGLVTLAAALMSCGWLEITGLAMLGGFVPLLVLASRYDSSARSWRRMLGWTVLFITLWYGLTVWWVWNATPAGPIAATILGWILSGLPFMGWFYVSKRAPKALSYTILVTAWTVGEWIYNTYQLSFPWLAVGNGFAHGPWAVQWYEWTGAYGGTIWVLVTSILIYECLIVRRPRRWLPPVLAATIPLIVSLTLHITYQAPLRTAKVTVVQPNIDPYGEKFDLPQSEQTANLAELAKEAPTDARFIVMPETAIWSEQIIEGDMASSPSLTTLRQTVAANSPQATLVVGATTYRLYGATKATATAGGDAERGYYDHYNSAIAISPEGTIDLHHKAKLVAGAEMLPTWFWVRWIQKLLARYDFYSGQYGVGIERTVFKNDDIYAGAGICWESVFGEYFSEFARNGAEVLFIITNDGWWRNTPGHRQHFDLARLRAVETRRAIARSANTGRSGFITPRGEVRQTLGWDVRGVITDELPLERRLTLYTRLGDWPCRISLLVLGLSTLYFIAWRIRRKDNIVP
ncbi:MAG: apolipoprotein N-acyltransferase [Alistipes sp.]|jgi:apolipoprotein N-acyltransferase|nr:apolipoprotein N-acyltransferase [Alistipes sp.]